MLAGGGDAPPLPLPPFSFFNLVPAGSSALAFSHSLRLNGRGALGTPSPAGRGRGRRRAGDAVDPITQTYRRHGTAAARPQPTASGLGPALRWAGRRSRRRGGAACYNVGSSCAAACIRVFACVRVKGSEECTLIKWVGCRMAATACYRVLPPRRHYTTSDTITMQNGEVSTEPCFPWSFIERVDVVGELCTALHAAYLVSGRPEMKPLHHSARVKSYSRTCPIGSPMIRMICY